MMDSHEKALRELEQKMQEGIAVSDQELLAALGKIRIMTNTWYAAFLIATLIAPICGYRPHLTKQLLPRMLYPLWLSGVGNEKQVIQWTETNLSAPHSFNGMSEVGLDWVKSLKDQTSLIREVFHEFSQADLQHELDELWGAFKAAIRIPRERVEFCSFWENDIFARIKKGVVFIQIVTFGDDEESQPKGPKNMRVLGTLTETLAKHDPDEKLVFLLFTWETYGDLVAYFERNDSHEIFLDVTPEKAHAVWVLNGKGIHVLSEDVIDLSVIEDYTLDLINQPA